MQNIRANFCRKTTKIQRKWVASSFFLFTEWMKKCLEGRVAIAEHICPHSWCVVGPTVQQGEDGGPWSVGSSVQGAAQVAARGGGTLGLGQKLAELCPPVSTQINLHTGTKLK